MIDLLTRGLTPVRPLLGSGWLLLRRTLAAADMIGVFLWIGGLRNGHAVAGFDLWHLTGATLAALAAGLAALLFAVPGRRSPTCLADRSRRHPLGRASGRRLRHRVAGGRGPFRIIWACLAYIGGFGTALALIMLRLTRHGAAFRPGPVAAFGALSAAAAASGGLTLLHPTRGPLMVHAWHGLAGAALAGATTLLTRPTWRYLA